MDMGGFVIIINAEKVEVGGAKDMQKMYYRHSGRPGSLKSENFKQLQAVSFQLPPKQLFWDKHSFICDAILKLRV